MAAFSVIALGAVVLPAVLLVVAAAAPVSRARVARFALRQQLVITPGNGDRVIAYLATIRRWRVAGLITVWIIGLAWLAYSITAQDAAEGEFPFVFLFAGWFVGAILAEAHLARRPAGTRRHAALTPRDLASYLPRFARAVVPTAIAISLTIGSASVVLAAWGHVDVATAIGAQLVALAITAAVWVVGRYVLRRPQPVLPSDEQAADDAIRSRALHVLAGSGVTLIMYAVNYQLSAIPLLPDRTLAVVTFVIAIGAPLLGWRIATAPWVVQRSAERTAAADL